MADPQTDTINMDRLSGAVGGGMDDMDKTLREDRAAVLRAKESAARPPVLEPMPQQAQVHTDPFEAFGQPAMWLAVFGSLLTRRPLTNAIQAGAAVLQGTAEKDASIARQNFETWKVNSENAVKLAKYEQDQLGNAVKLYQSDARAGEAAIRSHIAAFKNMALEDIYRREGIQGVEHYLKTSRKQSAGTEAGIASFTEHGTAKVDVAEALASGDPNRVADALETEAKQMKGLATKANRENVYASSLRLEVLAKKMRAAVASGDQTQLAEVQQESDQLLGPGVFRATPKATAVRPEERDVETIAKDNFVQKHQRQPTADDETEMARLRDAARSEAVASKTAATTAARTSASVKQDFLTPEAVDMEARQLLLTGQMPSLGFGGIEAREKILNRAAEMAKDEGHTIQDYISGRATIKADSASLSQITRISDAVVGFENTALKNMQIAESLMNKGAGTSAGPVINRWLQAGRKATGDPDVAAFNTAMGTVAGEYGKIISGGSASIAATPEGARQEAQEWLDKIQSPEAIAAQFSVAKRDMANRRQSLTQQRDVIRQRIRGGDVTGTPGTAAVPLPATKDQLIVDQVYETARGKARWDGSSFQPVGQ